MGTLWRAGMRKKKKTSVLNVNQSFYTLLTFLLYPHETKLDVIYMWFICSDLVK